MSLCFSNENRIFHKLYQKQQNVLKIKRCTGDVETDIKLYSLVKVRILNGRCLMAFILYKMSNRFGKGITKKQHETVLSRHCCKYIHFDDKFDKIL